jgi:hypothetical protein
VTTAGDHGAAGPSGAPAPAPRPGQPAQSGPQQRTIVLALVAMAVVAVLVVGVLSVIDGDGDDDGETSGRTRPAPTTTTSRPTPTTDPRPPATDPGTVPLPGGSTPRYADQPAPAGPPREAVVGVPTVLGGTRRGAAEVVAVVEDRASGHLAVARVRFGPEGTTEVWRTSLASVDDPVLLLDERVVAVVHEAEVVVLSLRDGVELWRHARGVAPPTCRTCVGLIDGRLVMPSAPDRLAAYDLRGSDPVWSTPLTDRAVVLDRAIVAATEGRTPGVDGDTPARTPAVWTIDPATGRAGPKFSPRCEAGAGDDVLELSEELTEVPGSRDLIGIGGAGGAACAVRWDPRVNAVRWIEEVPRGITFTSGSAVVRLVERQQGILPTTELVATVDLRTGAMEALPMPPDVVVSVRGRVDDLLVADYREQLGEEGVSKTGVLAWGLPAGVLAFKEPYIKETGGVPSVPGRIPTLEADLLTSQSVVAEDGVWHLKFYGATGRVDVDSVRLDDGSPRQPNVRYLVVAGAAPAVQVLEAVVADGAFVVVDGRVELLRFESSDRTAPSWPR